jgi:dihydroorotate dehydrogenase electron transfer subunit
VIGPCSGPRRLIAARVVDASSPAAGYGLIRVEPEQEVEARPGQFAMLGVPGGCGATLHRPMSILGSGRTLDFLIREVGRGSRALAALAQGDGLQMIAPLGTPFPPPSRRERVLMVGGGVGASPLLFQARLAAGAGAEPTMIYGGRAAADLVLAHEMRQVSDLVCTTEDGTMGERGLATDPLARALEAGGVDRVLACGPVAMMEAAAALALRASVPCLVCLEALMACGFGACLGCAVPAAGGGYLYACSDGPVLDARLVDWELMRAA